MIDGKTDKVLSLVLNNMSGGVFIWRKGKTDRLRFVLAPSLYLEIFIAATGSYTGAADSVP